MSTFAGGMFHRVQVALGWAPASPPPSPAEGAAPRERTALQQDLARRRAAYLREVQAERAHQAAMEQARQAAERERQRQMQDAVMEAIARSDHGVYWPGDRIPHTRRTWLGRLVDVLRSGG